MCRALLYPKLTQVALPGCPHNPTRHCPKVKWLVEGTAEATQVAVLANKPLRAFSKQIPFGKIIWRIDEGNKILLYIRLWVSSRVQGYIPQSVLQTIKLQNGKWEAFLQMTIDSHMSGLYQSHFFLTRLSQPWWQCWRYGLMLRLFRRFWAMVPCWFYWPMRI